MGSRVQFAESAGELVLKETPRNPAVSGFVPLWVGGGNARPLPHGSGSVRRGSAAGGGAMKGGWKRWFPLVLLLGATTLSGADVAGWVKAEGGGVVTDPGSGATRVDLAFTGIGDGGLETLRDVPRLRALDLAYARITDAGMERLKDLPEVAELNLYFVERITDVAMTYLRGWKRLERLSLRGADITDTGLDHVSGIGSLRALDASFTLITNVGLDHLGRLTGLEELSIGGNKISGAGLRFLPSLPALRRLDLSGVQRRNTEYWSAAVTDFDLDMIAASVRLEDLNLGGTQVSDLGAAKLEKLAALRRLDLSRTRVTGGPALPNLERLRLWRTKTSDAGAARLASLKSLQSLDLAETAITDQALEALATLPQLRDLYLEGTKVTAAGVDDLRKRAPNCRVHWK